MWKKCVDKVRGSLTLRIFLITACILVAACGAAYLFLAWATPISYTSIVNAELEKQGRQLAADLEKVTLEDCGPLVDQFIADYGADVAVFDQYGKVIALPTSLSFDSVLKADEAEGDTVVEEDPLQNGEGSGVSSEAVAVQEGQEAEEAEGDTVVEEDPFQNGEVSGVSSEVVVTVQEGGDDMYTTEDNAAAPANSAVEYPFSFLGSAQQYALIVSPRVTEVNQTAQAMARVLPYLGAVVLAIALLGALFYSRYITRPIVRISGISQRMSQLDFTSHCNDGRADEIGVLGRNLDELSHRLDRSLRELKEANAALVRDIDRERELERQRTAFFCAASHELKTPVTILKGQLNGMLAGVDVYKDRDKYLARSLAVTGRMESLIQETLIVSRMESPDYLPKRDKVDLSALVGEQMDEARDLAQLRGQELEGKIAPAVTVTGDELLLRRAVANLLSNALLHSPGGERVRVSVEAGESPLLRVTNSGASIPPEELPRLFQPFYRADPSRSRETGGSGLGLYIVKLILDQGGADCAFENTPDGVMAVVVFHSTQDTDILHTKHK